MKKLLKLTLTLLILNTLYLIPATAQVGINNDNSEPDASAMLDVKSDNKGMLVPRMSSSQRTMISNAATGLLVFDTDTESFWFKSSTVWIELVDEPSPMEHDTANNLVKPNEDVVDLATDDFVFGSPQLDDTGDADNDNRFFFDKSKGAFRAGRVFSTQWDDSNIGLQSVAFGSGTIASNFQTFAAGQNTTASGFSSVAFGNNTVSSATQSFAAGNASIASGNQSLSIGNIAEATENQSVAFGNVTKSTGEQSVAMGNRTEATANQSIAMGNETKASASSALAMGNRTQAISFAETALGTYNTLYTFTDSLSWNTNDRLFVIGNGLDESSRSDAFSILKNGNIALNGTVTIDSAYTLPSTDGSMGQVLTTDGSGTANWTSNTLLQDADDDTKIQVEESTDEDAIRFDVFDTEAVRIESDFSSASSINVNTIPSLGDLNYVTGPQPPDWQSFTATTKGKIDSLRMWMGRAGFTGVSIYNFSIYKGEGTNGTLLTSTSAAAPTGGVFFTGSLVGIPVTDEVILEKDSIYTISFDNEAGLGYKLGNPYANGRSGSTMDQDYILEVYAFTASPNTTINGTLNVTGGDANVTADAFVGDGSALTNLPIQVPIGTIIMWPSETLPAGWIPCNGQPFFQSTYPELFDILGDTGDGTANVPNFRGRFPLGLGNSQTTFSTNHAIKSTGGFEKHALSIQEMPAHTHGIQYREGEEQGSGNDYSDLGDTGVNDSTQSTGGDSNGNTVAHNNMPPFYTINFIIKAEN